MNATVETPKLSPREWQIMRLVAKGETIPSIGATLKISPHTVCNHLRRVYLKTGSHSRIEAACKLAFSDPRQLSLFP